MKVITVILFGFTFESESFTSVLPTDSFLDWFLERLKKKSDCLIEFS